jgi:hypothetical protein
VIPVATGRTSRAGCLAASSIITPDVLITYIYTHTHIDIGNKYRSLYFFLLERTNVMALKV